MSSLTTYMGLIRWDGLSDLFNHSQLAANLDAMDAHRHIQGEGQQIPSGGIASLAITTGKIVDGAVTAAKLASGAVTSSKLASNSVSSGNIVDGTILAADLANSAVTTGKINNGAVTDAKLASPNNDTAKLISFARGTLLDAGAGNPAAGTYMLGTVFHGTTYGMIPSGAAFNTQTDTGPQPIRLISGDYDVPSLATMLSIQSHVSTNDTAPGVDFNIRLYPLTVAGTSDALAFTLGSAVAGSVSTHTTPGAHTIDLASSGDFAFPTNGVYALGVGVSGSFAANAAVQVSASLRYSNT